MINLTLPFISAITLGFINATLQFGDKILFLILSYREVLTLKFLFAIIPFIIIIFYIIISKTYKSSKFNRKIIFFNGLQMFIGFGTVLFSYFLIQQYEPGLIVPISLSSIIISSQIINSYFYNYKMTFKQYICIFVIGICVFILSHESYKQKKIFHYTNITEYLKK